MNRTIRRTVSVLAGVLVAVGVGACADQERTAQTRHNAEPELRTDLTMDDLAGEWRFDPQEAEAAIIEQVEANIAAIDDREARREVRSRLPELTQPAIDALTGVRVTLHADGTLRSTSVDEQGRQEELEGSWTLDGGVVVFSVRSPDRFDEDVSAALVIDSETMEINVGESDEEPMVLLLRKRS